MKRFIVVIAVIVFGYAAVRPLFAPGYFPMHDDTQVSRVIAMGKAITERQFPVRWVADLGYGYGYPIFNFYGPLPYYVGGLLYAFGVPALVATKMMFGIGILVPAVVLYLVMHAVVGWEAALVSALLYLFAPYHAVQIYVRGAVGEYWSLLFWPLLLYAVFSMSRNGRERAGVLAGAVGLAGSLVTHTLFGYVTALFLVTGIGVFWIIKGMKKRWDAALGIRHGTMVLLGLGMSAFFWLPAVSEMRYTDVAGQVSATAWYADHFVCPGQLWSSLWGFGGSAPGCIDGMSYMLGKLHILLAAAGIVTWVLTKRKEPSAVFRAGMLMTLLGIFFATSVSRPVWSVLPYFPYLQYPWRFLSVAVLGLSILGGVTVWLIPHGRGRTAFAIGIGVLIMLMNAKRFVPQYTYPIQSSDFERVSDLHWRASRISDEYLPPDIRRPEREDQVNFDTIRGGRGLRVLTLSETAVALNMVVESSGAADITVNRAYFPGWRYTVNNAEVRPEVVRGLPVLHVEAGQSVIDMHLTDTPVRTIANIVSLISVLLFGMLVYEKQRLSNR